MKMKMPIILKMWMNMGRMNGALGEAEANQRVPHPSDKRIGPNRMEEMGCWE